MKKKRIQIFIFTLICLLFLSSIQIVSDSVNSTSNKNVNFIIIAPETFIDNLIPLSTYKNNNNLSTKIISIENIITQKISLLEYKQGRDNAETIKLFIAKVNREWNTSYVMLVGSKQQVPIRYARINVDSSSNETIFLNKQMNLLQPDVFQMVNQYISDLYYADLFFENGTFCSWDTNNNMRFAEKNETQQIDIIDINPDIALGRLLCTSKEEVDYAVNKIIQYEKNYNNNAIWKHNLTVCGGDTHSLWRDLIIKLVYPSDNVHIAWEGEFMGNQVAQMLPDYAVKKVYATDLNDLDTQFISTENINNAISEGCNLLLMAGHGYPQAWGTHPPSFFGKIWLPGPIINPSLYQSSDVLQLQNSEMLPVAIISACSCGDFNHTDDPIAWTFVEHKTGGAIASFACTTLGTLLPSSLCTQSLNGKLTMGIFESYQKGTRRIGDIWIDSISYYLNDENAMQLGTFGGAFWLNQFNLEEWILFGDPTIVIN